MFSLALPIALVRKIRRFARDDLLDKLVGLSLYPEYQANLLRVITLIHVALIELNGSKTSNPQ